jgi:HupE / UreJ protein
MFQTDFFSYVQLGFFHIADLTSYDHILFVTALCAMYDPLRSRAEMHRLLWLITAFTVGHSFTLALSVLNMLTFSTTIIEFLIPVTIFLTAAANMAALRRMNVGTAMATAVSYERLKYAVTLCFGCIHGMGFSTFLKSLLGRETNITVPLLAFNCGLEVGQILIITIIAALTFAATRFLEFQRRDWAFVLSGAAAGVALTLMVKNNPFAG